MNARAGLRSGKMMSEPSPLRADKIGACIGSKCCKKVRRIQVALNFFSDCFSCLCFILFF